MGDIIGAGLDGGTYLGYIVCITLLMFIGTMRAFDRELRKKFIIVTFVMMIALGAGAADIYYSSLKEPVFSRYIVRLVKYLCEGYMELVLVQIVGHDYKASRSIIIWIPYIVISMLMLTAPINPDIFYFTADNQFVRGYLGYAVFMQAVIYIMMDLAVVIKKWYDGYQRDAVMILYMVAVVVIGVCLEEAKIFKNCTIISSTIGILFVYIYIYAERYNVDSVSKCYKRRCFYSDAAKYARVHMAIISMDLNDLKYINDNYGHKAGDIALLTFAEVCRSVKTNNFILYRTGGDEFMILGIKASEQEASNLIRLIREKLKETPYSCSFGLQMYSPGDDFDAAVVAADKAMYDDKSIYKASKTKRSHARNDDYANNFETFTNDIRFL